MSEVVLGRLIEGRADRDAIHVAVVPMRAADRLRPGERVGIVSRGVAGSSEPHVGIVDPYLNEDVRKGDMFWLCLFPNTVTGMRHHWSHPAFDMVTDEEREASRRYLMGVLDNCPDDNGKYNEYQEGELQRVLDAAVNSTNEEYLFLSTEVYGEIPGGFWFHVERLTGQKCVHAQYFRCGC